MAATRSVRSPGRAWIGVICGNDTDRARAPASAPVPVRGSTDIFEFIPERLALRRLHVHRNYLKNPVKHDLTGIDVIFNLITDADLHPRVLDISGKWLKGYRGRVLNPPRVVLRNTRDSVAALLQGIPGLTMPVTIRLPRNPKAVAAAISRARIVFPAILRETGSHSGRALALVETLDQVVAGMERGKDYYLTQFVDTRGEDGLYRKVRAFCFGRTWIVRHQLISDHWKVHSANANRFMADHPRLMAEEAAFITAGAEGLSAQTHAILEQVRQKVGLDFFGLDFSIGADGGLVIFEANATMNLLPVATGPGFDHMQGVKEKAARAVEAMLADVRPV